ncbi:hypothetical protein SCHPADRAFT_925914 [Schizopora paradoxa]|uniref:Uncharacterized protein n=1 Tax=Schizopora paradoxa TaxID=27342 RepID=A0A0H2SJG4_9AGAM|nr:hypothetical protein SCHPADRAFT_925914 [Schizopora paradoxa]
MPTVRYASGFKYRGENLSFRMKTVHNVLLGPQTDSTPINLSKSLPSSVDIVLPENLSISVSVIVGKAQWSNKIVKSSLIAQHLVQFFRKNASSLAISHVSDVYLDDDDGDTVKVSITPKYGVDDSLRVTPLASLQSIHITYRIKLDEESGIANPTFSLDTLNGLMNKFVTYQLIRRYPLIFGHKAERVHHEKQLFPSVARSLMTMSERSPNAYFQEQVRRHLKLLKKRLKAADHLARDDLRQQCGIEDDDLPPLTCTSRQGELEAEAILCLGIRQLYNLAIGTSSFKGQDVQEDEFNSNSLNDQEPVHEPIQTLSQQEPRHEAIEALLDIVNSSDGLDLHRSEEGESEWDQQDVEWPSLPSPPSSLPLEEHDIFVAHDLIEDGQTIACDDIIMPGVLEKSHARYSRPPSSLASLQLCDSDLDSSALHPEPGYSSGDSAFVCAQTGSFNGHSARLTCNPSDFEFTEDEDEPITSFASQGPRRDNGLLDFTSEEIAHATFSATKDDEFDEIGRVNCGLNGLPTDADAFPFERARRLTGHEAPSVSISATQDTISSDEVLGVAGGVRLLNDSLHSGCWPSQQPSMSPPPSEGYFKRTRGERVGLDLTHNDEDDFATFEWDLTATPGQSPASISFADSAGSYGALNDDVARRGQHCELDFNQRPSSIGCSPDRPEEVAWDAVEEEDEFRISDVDMEIGAGNESAPFEWSREEDELELELSC